MNFEDVSGLGLIFLLFGLLGIANPRLGFVLVYVTGALMNLYIYIHG